ncbi:hsp90 co-chaperone Cdc37-like [Schistocerca serialis cubense]|uniref:hsp90 co-chaperone Cdc37-like n=1 Tax=Schistocerca serialis cubense TaxID=2023355 RepID=UPI00214E6BDF|nr:hsp90 co-chaperone Cdc37-like [Schistocerca serialis cubense]
MVDYSKWKDIEISDFEDDTHINIDTSSLFRWRYQARIERMEDVDAIGKPGFVRTVINTAPKPKREVLSEEEQGKRLKEQFAKYEKFIKISEMLCFLKDHPEHVSEHTANYLVTWCIRLEMEEKHDLIEMIQARATMKRKTALAEAEEEERKARLASGGFNILKILETLSRQLEKCFEGQDVRLLQQINLNVPEQEAQYHMKRCIGSGFVGSRYKKKNLQKEKLQLLMTIKLF